MDPEACKEWSKEVKLNSLESQGSWLVIQGTGKVQICSPFKKPVSTEGIQLLRGSIPGLGDCLAGRLWSGYRFGAAAFPVCVYFQHTYSSHIWGMDQRSEGSSACPDAVPGPKWYQNHLCAQLPAHGSIPAWLESKELGKSLPLSYQSKPQVAWGINTPWTWTT